MAAPTAVYVDPAIAGNSGTGTSLDPYGDLQYALDTKARDTTNGDAFHVKVGTAEVLAASLSFTTYGTPTAAAPCYIIGYTATALDRGVGQIDANGNTFFASAAIPYVYLIDLELYNFGNNNGLYSYGTDCTLFHCKVHKGASTPSSKVLAGVMYVIGCHVYNANTGGTGIGGYAGRVAYNYVYNCPTGINSGSAFRNVLVSCDAGIGSAAAMALENTIYHSSATGTACAARLAINNVIEGYSGSGGKGLAITDPIVWGYSALYNNATPESITDGLFDLGGDQSLAASPFTNAGSGDFSLVTTSGAADGAFPGTWYGPASTTDHADIGAVQNGAGMAGGGMPILGGSVIR